MDDSVSPPPSASVGLNRVRFLSVADQIVWSGANAVTLVAAARLLSIADFGAFSACALIVLLAVAISRAFITEPLLLKVSEPMELDRHGGDGRRAVLGAAVIFAPVASVVATLIVLVPDIDAQEVALLVAACLMSVCQDAVRFVAIGLGRPDLALVSDLSWMIVAVGFLATTFSADRATTSSALLWWIGGAGTAVIVGLVVLRSWPDLSAGRRWIRRTARVGRALAADALIGVGSANISMLLVGRVAGSDELAGLRGAFLLLGPMNSITEGIYIAAIPLLAGRTVVGRRIVGPAVRVTMVLCASWVIFSLLVLSLPDSVLVDILGATWTVASDIVPILLGASVIGAVAIGGNYGVRAWRGASQLARIRIYLIPVYLLVLPFAATFDGARSYAFGLVAVALLQTGIYWSRFLALDRAALDRQQ